MLYRKDIIPTKYDAITSLVGGPIKWTEDPDVVEYLSGQTPPSEAEIDAELVKLQAEYDALAWKRSRQVAYPSLADQADMQYHDQIDGTTTWKDAIAKVKSDNPKE